MFEISFRISLTSECFVANSEIYMLVDKCKRCTNFACTFSRRFCITAKSMSKKVNASVLLCCASNDTLFLHTFLIKILLDWSAIGWVISVCVCVCVRTFRCLNTKHHLICLGALVSSCLWHSSLVTQSNAPTQVNLYKSQLTPACIRNAISWDFCRWVVVACTAVSRQCCTHLRIYESAINWH